MTGRLYADLRDFIDQVERLGALRRIDGADPVCEIGGITEVAAGSPDCPALLFERMQGCAPSFRVFTNATTTPQRAALALNVKTPLVYSSVALRNWTAFRKLGIRRVYAPGSYHSSFDLNPTVDIGGYASPRSPEEPVLISMERAPALPGLNEREQHKDPHQARHRLTSLRPRNSAVAHFPSRPSRNRPAGISERDEMINSQRLGNAQKNFQHGFHIR